MRITTIENEHMSMLDEFCKECQKLGYQNNISLKAMRFDLIKEQGEFFCAIKNDKIVAVAGCHPMPEASPNGWRILFRGCELPGHDTFRGLGKGNWNSITQREFIPKFIDFCPSDELYITTNIHNEHSNGKASRNHRNMTLLAKQGILDKVRDMYYYNTDQTLWKLNISEYLRRRERLTGKYVD